MQPLKKDGNTFVNMTAGCICYGYCANRCQPIKTANVDIYPYH